MEQTKSISPPSVREFLSRATSMYFQHKFSFALWRLPDASALYLAASENPQELSSISLEDTAPGFLFAPFDPAGKKIHLPADDLFRFESGQLTATQGSKLNEIPINEFSQEAFTKAKCYYESAYPAKAVPERNFHQLVADCKEAIERGYFEKIVPSRSASVELPVDFDIIDAFHELCELNPHAMVTVFSSPLTGTWVGATPEMLVCVGKDQHFHTVAVAGTQPYAEGVDLRSVTWTQKDIEEQALVERYIISCFKKIRVREFEEQGPKTVVAGNLLHLKTHFDVDMAAINFPELGTVMLKLLHPTSAVCGMPLEPSLEFLKNQEGYDRQFYSGYLGPVNVQEESHIYVNLRCMQLFANVALLYAGAGVLADSDPEREWKETELKMNTLGRIIRR